MDLLSLVIFLIIVGAILYLVSLLPIDATILTIIRAVVILLVILYLLQWLFGMGIGSLSLHLPRQPPVRP